MKIICLFYQKFLSLSKTSDHYLVYLNLKFLTNLREIGFTDDTLALNNGIDGRFFYELYPSFCAYQVGQIIH